MGSGTVGLPSLPPDCRGDTCRQAWIGPRRRVQPKSSPRTRTSPTSAARIGATNMKRFMEFVAERYDANAVDYDTLWSWSIDNLDKFWTAVWDFSGVKAETRGARALDVGSGAPEGDQLAVALEAPVPVDDLRDGLAEVLLVVHQQDVDGADAHRLTGSSGGRPTRARTS